MAGVDGLCSNARPGEFVVEEGVIEAKKAKSFTFVVIPLEVQDYIITIYMFSSFGNDAVGKTLHVVVSAFLNERISTEQICLSINSAKFFFIIPICYLLKVADYELEYNP